MVSYGAKLDKSFYMRDTLTVTEELLGKMLVHVDDEGAETVAEIMETEAYTGVEDKACHSYNGRKTGRMIVMYRDGGYAYVYSLYGHALFNAVTEAEGIPCCVLVRRCRPIDGLGLMAQRRYGKEYAKLGRTAVREMMSGPGKVCQAMGITTRHNSLNLTGGKLFIAEPLLQQRFQVGQGKRINLGKVGEAANYPYRYFIKKNVQ
ncbi:MAG: DNA-3-methyladenine glycosylase [Oscillospiraceae bacterium]|jgi:DNA-3-methyladenine glycosylase|nr:DNA-3-methyladenine glycosylase [Oscillospiraceae bacterium]